MDKSRLHQFGAKVLQIICIGHVLSYGGGRTRDLIIADWHDIENYVAFEVHVKNFTSKDVRIKKLQEALIFLFAAAGSPRQGRPRTTSNLALPETRMLRRGRRTLDFGRREWLPFAFCKEQLFARKRAVEDFSKADCDAAEARRISGVCLENPLSITTLCSENNCMHRNSCHSPDLRNTLTSRGKQ